MINSYEKFNVKLPQSPSIYKAKGWGREGDQSSSFVTNILKMVKIDDMWIRKKQKPRKFHCASFKTILGAYWILSCAINIFSRCYLEQKKIKTCPKGAAFVGHVEGGGTSTLLCATPCLSSSSFLSLIMMSLSLLFLLISN